VLATVGSMWMGFTAPARGQYLIEDGRARDASNRVGDYGRNDLSTNYRQDFRASPNQIITNNVAGLYGFRGNVGYREAKEFRGPVASSFSDSFIRRSSGGYTGYGAAGKNYPTAFYSSSRTVGSPGNYVREGYGLGAYVPKPSTSDQTVQYETSRGGYFDRVTTLPPPNTMVLPSPTGSDSGSFISASPLTGIQRYQPGQVAAGGEPSFLAGDLPRWADAARLDAASVRRMREELGQGATGTAADQGRQDESTEPGAVQPIQPIGTPLGSPLGKPVDASVAPAQGTRYRFTLPPEQQSEQYAKMLKQLEATNADRTLTDEQAFRAYQAAKKGATVDPNAPQTTPGVKGEQPAPKPGEAAPQGSTPPVKLPDGTTSEPGAKKPAPIKVDSLAAGVTGKGLADLLSDAEAKMRDGKFAAAIDRYDAAEQVAPNNPLIALGRANAELGAGYYSRAEAHLRDAFTADRALLVGQYNLENFLGEERLQFLVKDLKEIANREKTEARPVFLLAYVAYNTGNERMAAGYLDLAEKREGGKDPLYPLIRKHWSLPSEPVNDNLIEEPATRPTKAKAPDGPNK
jgi:tetratricopeptide (TPR) repeat protein